MNNKSTRAVILALLAVLMVVTRSHLQYHFMPVPDASWAVFFIAGFYLRGWGKWAFPALMALAVAVDYVVISGQGTAFFSHYCVTPGYLALLPAYFVLWMGGSFARRYFGESAGKFAGVAVGSLLLSVMVCQLLAQGAFYWLTNAIATPTLAGWAQNYFEWLLPYLGAVAMYTAVAAVAHVAIAAVTRTAKAKSSSL